MDSASVAVPVIAPVDVLNVRPAGSVPSKLYDAAGLPVFLATEMLTAVTLSVANDEVESVMIGAKTYEVKAPEETPDPAALVTWMVPDALPARVVAVMLVLLTTVNVSTGLPPIETAVVPLK